MSYEAVTFDFWNTLIPETRDAVDRRRALWADVLGGAGATATGDELDAAFKDAWEFFDGRWRSNEPTDVYEVADRAIAALPFAVPDAVADALTEAYVRASDETPRTLAPTAAETLHRLSDLGLGIAVICDVGTVPGTKLRTWLDELGVGGLVGAFAFSDEVGAYKPDPRMFRHALTALSIGDPSRAAHVGDIKRTDVAGARAVGMTAVRYEGVRKDDEDGPEADHVIDRLDSLFDVLDLA